MCRAVVGQMFIGDEHIFLAKPQTYMNLSGEAVVELCRRFRVSPVDLIVVHDDLDLPLGKLRIRPKGSAGGHKGMLSIISRLHNDEFTRIRIGIGDADREPIEFVLSRFSRDELSLIRPVINRAADALECILMEGIEAAMNKFN